ncbi:MAG TPA: glyoxalase superfamily protein [Candidatus Didemnitutus sp.]|jgi:predicted enzyme related to lactoylglutathione lyase
MSIQVKEFAFVIHTVSDVPRARAFYEGLLGLKAAIEFEFAPGTWWIEYDVAGQALAISNAYGEVKPADNLYLEVADIDAALAAAKAAGVPIALELAEFPPCRMFAVKDPDGNRIGLHQKKKP